jgi:hypothetical protein
LVDTLGGKEKLAGLGKEQTAGLHQRRALLIIPCFQ